MTSKEIWNLIVAEREMYLDDLEKHVEKRWTSYFKNIFGYDDSEVVNQYHMPLGSGKIIISDILIQDKNGFFLDVELKRYDAPFEDNFLVQLKSYMKQLDIEIGLIICNSIYVIYLPKKEIKELKIPFSKDNSAGIELIELLQKNNFSKDKIISFIDKNLKVDNEIKEIKEWLLTTDYGINEITDSLLRDGYSQTSIDKAMKQIVVSIYAKQIGPGPDPGPGVVPGLETDGSKLWEIMRKWCQKQNIEGNIVYYPNKSNRTYTRLSIPNLDKILPEQIAKKSGWGTGHFYYIEIEWRDPGYMKFKLELNNNNTPGEFQNIYTKIFNYFGRYPSKENWQWFEVFNSKIFLKNQKPDTFDCSLDQAFKTFNERIQEFVKYFNTYCK